LSAPQVREAEQNGVIVGADGFSLETAGPAPSAFKLGEQV
jgi:hypothetical protein